MKFIRLVLVWSCFAVQLFFLPIATAEGARSPLEATQKAQEAIDSCDYALFASVVDIPAVTQSGLDDILIFIKEYCDNQDSSQIDPVFALLLSQVDLNNPSTTMMVKQFLGAELNQFVIHGINGGNFSGNQCNTAIAPKDGLASLLLSSLSQGKKEIQGQKVLNQSGNQALVQAVLKDHEAGSFPLELLMMKNEQGWRVIRINNAAQLAKSTIK